MSLKQKVMPAGRRGDAKLKVTLIVVALFLIAGYFVSKKYVPNVLNVLPTTEPGSLNEKPVVNLPVIVEPRGSKMVSPQKVRGTVPPGWMFEGSFPIKLLDSNRKLIVQTNAVEEVPGSWQSNTPVYFTVTLAFTTTAKSGFLVLMNDNPSGDPANSKTFEVPVGF